MRTLAIAASALVLTAGAANATSPIPTDTEVRVTVGPELQKKAEKIYGVRDVNDLAQDLQSSVSKELARTGVLAGARINLTLVDATPNRPTMKQMSDKPGLSSWSFGLGGAEIQGEAVSPDGVVTPISYRWYEHDIRQAWYNTTWGDANRAIDRLAHKLSRGQVLASR